jgi:protein SCO1/2
VQKNKLIYLLLLLIPLGFVSVYFLKKKDNKPVRTLPYFGQKNYSRDQDTSYHTVPGFEFINQLGEKVTEEKIKGKIYVADYFFTTCQSICPVMSNQMERVAEHFKHEPSVMFLSHTVNPEEDSVNVLKTYAEQHHADPRRWQFLTGNKKALYELARKGYLLNAEEGNGGADDFIHTQNFALVDKERHLRGFYDGTDSTDMNRMIKDIEMLLNEYNWKEKNR